jgi:hypothetical protein
MHFHHLILCAISYTFISHLKWGKRAANRLGKDNCVLEGHVTAIATFPSASRILFFASTKWMDKHHFSIKAEFNFSVQPSHTLPQYPTRVRRTRPTSAPHLTARPSSSASLPPSSTQPRLVPTRSDSADVAVAEMIRVDQAEQSKTEAHMWQNAHARHCCSESDEIVSGSTALASYECFQSRQRV